jgi:hypothetical protein
VFLPGAGDLDLTERTWRGEFVIVRREARQDEHPARASEDLPGPALSGKLDREADAWVDARVAHRGENAPVLVGSVPRAVRARPPRSRSLRPLLLERLAPLVRRARGVLRYVLLFAKPCCHAVDRIDHTFGRPHAKLLPLT